MSTATTEPRTTEPRTDQQSQGSKQDTPATTRRTIGVRRRSIRRGPWSWAHLVGGIAGLTAIVLGAVALARTGIPTDTVTAPHIVAGWLHHTPLLALLHLGLGAILLAASTTPSRDTGGLTSLGVFLGVVGLVAAIEPTAFHDALGFHAAHGVTYLAAGVLLTVAGIASPIYERDGVEEIDLR